MGSATTNSTDCRPELEELLRQRILVLDGAMGTTIREYGLDEKAARGDRFAKNEKDLLNNGHDPQIPRRMIESNDPACRHRGIGWDGNENR